MTLKLIFHAEVKDSEDIRGICEQIGMCFEELGNIRLRYVSQVQDGSLPRFGRGPYKNVMLSDVGVAELEERFGKARAEALIADLSYKLYQKNYRYSDHFAVIVEWEEKTMELRREQAPALQREGGTHGKAASFDVDEFFNAAVKKGVGE